MATKSLRINPYSPWDTGLNPRFYLWELYKKPVCEIKDERNYSNSALIFLRKHAQLIDTSTFIEKETELQEEGGGFQFLSDEGNRINFLYKHNFVQVLIDEEEKLSISVYYPANKKSVHPEFQKWIIEEKEGASKVSIIMQRNGMLMIKPLSFEPPVIPDMELNYGAGFSKIYDKVLEKLNKNQGGLMIFSGVAGSGKSTFIKHLSSCVDREFIFVPVGMAGRLNDESLLPLLINHKEAVLVIEDAEKVIQPRDGLYDDSIVSTILNISDGILGNIMKTTIILSLNNDTYIDSAILRKGRLIFKYKFNELKLEDAKKMAEKLGKDASLVTGPMSLADIYGLGEENIFEEKKTEIPLRKIGFNQG